MYKKLSEEEWERAYKEASKNRDPKLFEANMNKIMTILPMVMEYLIAGKNTKWVAKKFDLKIESVELLRNELKRGGKL